MDKLFITFGFVNLLNLTVEKWDETVDLGHERCIYTKSLRSLYSCVLSIHVIVQPKCCVYICGREHQIAGSCVVTVNPHFHTLQPVSLRITQLGSALYHVKRKIISPHNAMSEEDCAQADGYNVISVWKFSVSSERYNNPWEDDNLRLSFPAFDKLNTLKVTVSHPIQFDVFFFLSFFLSRL